MTFFKKISTALVFALGITYATGVVLAQSLPMVTIDAARLARTNGQSILIDIREPSEHAQGVAEGAILIPMSQMAGQLSELSKSSDKPLHVICNTTNRSKRMVAALHERGYFNASYVNGGKNEWYQRHLPTVKPLAK